MGYEPTTKQAEAWKLLREGPRHVMLVGGSRSGKTTVIVEEIICRALFYPKSRHLIARLRFAHAKTSLWLDTLPSIMDMEGIKRSSLKISEADHYVKFNNGSEIWIDGLDDKERVEKVLGREYATIHFNEVSQITYSSILMVLTRLAQNIKGCQNKVFYDLNPVGRMHWAYKLFVLGIDPDTGQEITNPKDYASLSINPDDNRDHLPEGYIEDVLERLPKHKKRRFLHGEWGDPEGVIFTGWDIIDEVPEQVMRHVKSSYGLDFGFSVHPSAFVWLGLLGDDLYIDEIFYEPGLTNHAIAQRIKQADPKDLIYADSAEPKSVYELQTEGINIIGAAKGPDSIRQGLDWMLSKNIHVTKRSANIQMELMNYQWKVNRNEQALPEPIDDFNHAVDSCRYGAEAFRSGKEIFIA